MHLYINKHIRIKAFCFLIITVILFICSCHSPFIRSGKPVVIGIMADVQYADKNDRGTHYLRASLKKLENCVKEMNMRKPAFVIQLGDLIDGHEKDINQTKKDLLTVLKIFNKFTMPKYHVIGNHCLSAGKEVLQQELDLDEFYYDFTIRAAKGWRFIVLDSNDIGGNKQFKWFISVIAEAAKKKEKVICFCHMPLISMNVNHLEILSESILNAIDNAGCVVAWIAGHNHEGGYTLRQGVHYITIKGMIETPGKNAYALFELYPDKLKEIGFGREPVRDFFLSPPQKNYKR